MSEDYLVAEESCFYIKSFSAFTKTSFIYFWLKLNFVGLGHYATSKWDAPLMKYFQNNFLFLMGIIFACFWSLLKCPNFLQLHFDS